MIYSSSINRVLIKIWRDILSHSVQPQAILITSALSEEGSTTVAVNLAKILSEENNSKILLIEGNIRNPVIQDILNLPGTKGLTDHILNNAPLHEVIQATSIPNLSVICSGSNKEDFFSFDATKQFTRLIEQVKEEYKIILFDALPVLEYPKTAFISSHFDGTILIVRAHKTLRSDVEKAKEEIINSGGKILGVILNRKKNYVPEKIYRKYFGHD